MNKKTKQILDEAERIIATHREDTSIYYKELKKSYKEYKELDNRDKTTNELYLKHIENLTELLNTKNNAAISIITMTIVFTIMLSLTIYSTYKYYDISRNLKNDVIKMNNRSSLIVNYINLNDFEALVMSDLTEYEELTPLELSVGALSENNKKMHYNIYLIEKNEDIKEENLLKRKVFLYNVKTKNKNSGIKRLENSIIEKGKILLFSGELENNEIDNIELRMWIDKNTEEQFLNKNYKFTLYVDGYEI